MYVAKYSCEESVIFGLIEKKLNFGRYLIKKMSSARFVNTVFREIKKAQKQAERERIRSEKKYLREQKLLQKEILRQEKEALKEKIRYSKEQIRLKKENFKKEWDTGINNCEKRFKSRNQLRLTFIR